MIAMDIYYAEHMSLWLDPGSSGKRFPRLSRSANRIVRGPPAQAGNSAGSVLPVA